MRTETRKMQYLYADGTDAHFMDLATTTSSRSPRTRSEPLKWIMPNEEIELLYVDE